MCIRDSGNSTWNLVPADVEGTYYIINEATSRILDADRQFSGYDVNTAGSPTAIGGTWYFEDAGDGSYYVVNADLDRFLDADGRGSGFNVDTNPSSRDDRQWVLNPVAAGPEGAVYVATNLDGGNAIAAFERNADGTLSSLGEFATGGLGSTEFDGGEGLDPLISADSIIVTDDESILLAVNAGSDTISSFAILDDFTLELIDVVDSGGVGPNSIAYDNGRVFVTNIDRDGLAFGGPDPRAEPNDEGNVVGFTLAADGTLTATGFSADLDNRPANLDFSTDGNHIITTSITSGSAVLPGPNAGESVHLFSVGADGSLTLADTNNSNSGPQEVVVTVENLQGAEGIPFDSALGTFNTVFPGNGDAFDVETETFATESGFFFTEPWVGLHDGTFDLFDAGSPASASIEEIAEGGGASGIFADFDAAFPDGRGDFDAFIQNEAQLQFISPGDVIDGSFEIRNPAAYRYFSFASMIIPSNDAFFSNDDPTAYEVFDAEGNFNGPVVIDITTADIYDCLLYTSPSPRDATLSRMPSSA